MKLLVIGNGSRESAICWKLVQSKKVEKIYIAPGNGGTLEYGENINISQDNITGLLEFAIENNIALTIVGPELPLSLGIVDEFQKAGLKIFGPTKDAAKIETSKAFAKEIMKKNNIATAKYGEFYSYETSQEYLYKQGVPIVIKLDGLAGGKGVSVVFDIKEADEILKKIYKQNKKEKIIIEEYLEGQEASILAFVDGNTIKMMPAAQDHKRIYDNDEGPNTGGMGAYAPAPIISQKIYKLVYNDILEPTINGLRKEGIIYKGILYAGIIITKEGPKVIEFNARFGDPETQVILPLLNSDLLEIMFFSVEGNLKDINILWKEEKAVSVVLASQGYPASYEKGKKITGIDNIKENGFMVFQGGTQKIKDDLFTNGGRVLNIVKSGNDLGMIIKELYNNIDKINFEGRYYRKDIGKKALS